MHPEYQQDLFSDVERTEADVGTVLRHYVSVFNEEDDLRGLIYELPRAAGSMNDPFLSVYGNQNYLGVSFKDIVGGYHEEILFGIETEEDLERLSSPDDKTLDTLKQVPTHELKPFLHVENRGVMEYVIPIDGERGIRLEFHLTEERKDENISLEAFNGEEKIYDLSIGRREGPGWSYIARQL